MRLLDRLAGSPRLRLAYYRASRIPLVAQAQRMVSRALVPVGALRLVTVPAGRNAGLEMRVDPRAEVGYLRGDHEPWLQELLAEWLTPGDVFVDAGSHCGFMSLVAARVVGQEGHVLAFEPDPSTYTRLAEHVARNRLSQVRPMHAAVWHADGEIGFLSSVGSDAGVTGHVEADSETTVPTVTLDAALADRSGGGVIKVDVEGAELAVLDGARATLAAARYRWIVETHGDALHEAVVVRFEEAGYEVEVVQPVHDVYTDYRQEYVLAVPTDRVLRPA